MAAHLLFVVAPAKFIRILLTVACEGQAKVR